MLSRRVLATVLVVSLSGFAVPAQEAPPAATLSGAVVSVAGRTPLVGATVHAADPKTGQVYSSGPSTEDGLFEIRGLPATTLELGVQVDEGLYLVETPVSLAAAKNQRVHIAVAPHPQTDHSTGYRKTRSSLWNNPLTAALIVVGAAVVIGALVTAATEDDDSASPSGI
jgi:hypothetical protein